jgi:hypothetical protein
MPQGTFTQIAALSETAGPNLQVPSLPSTVVDAVEFHFEGCWRQYF